MEELGIFLLLVILMVVILYYTNRKEGMWGGGCGCRRGCNCPFCRWNTMRSGLNNMPNYM